VFASKGVPFLRSDEGAGRPLIKSIYSFALILPPMEKVSRRGFNFIFELCLHKKYGLG
jgi:hypothetical protein